MFIEKLVDMQRIEKKNGYVYLVEGEKGFETYYNLGKDYDYWEKPKQKKKWNKKNKSED